jgi:23S rRNA (uracil1939-C5)-methyltransferase
VPCVVERLSIKRLGHRGDGVTDGPTGPIYVPYTLPGEIVEVEAWQGHPDRRHLLAVERPSSERIAPICPHFGVCGGCALQHWREDRYRAWKRDLVATALSQVGLSTEVDALVDAHGEGRRRAVFHARRTTHGILQVGFAALHAHHIVGIDHCPILAPGLKGAIAIAWAIAEGLALEAKPLDIQVTATESGLDVDVRGSGPLSPQRLTALANLAERHRIARLTRHGELVAQRAKPTVRMGRAAVPLPPGSFLQATAEGETALTHLVTARVGSAKNVADLFAGVGPFALRLAERARVIAVDADEAAVSALREASTTTSGLKPIDAIRRDLFRQPLVAQELARLDAVVFDPPRQGAEQQAHQLARSSVPRVVAVSCNQTTFARDAKILESGGYRITAVTPVDQFRYSAHVEIVACFVR